MKSTKYLNLLRNPFRRLFSLTDEAIEANTPFERFLAEADFEQLVEA